MTNLMSSDEHDALVLEEVRWETIERCSWCNCGLAGDGPPCPHGNYIPAEKITQADIAKAILKDWEPDGDDEDDDEEIIFLSIEGDAEVELDEATLDETAGTGIPNLGAGWARASDVADSDQEKEWFFNETTKEWEER